MKKLLKLFGTIALIALVMFSFAACGGSDNNGGGGGGGGGGATLDKLVFYDRGDDTYMVSALSTNISGAVVIPATYQGKPVAWLALDAFRDCTRITSVTIPNSIPEIGFNAFTNSSVTSVNIPSSVTEIGILAFDRCESLTSVKFEGTISSDNIRGTSFPGDLKEKYIAGGAGTYTRSKGSDTWTKN